MCVCGVYRGVCGVGGIQVCMCVCGVYRCVCMCVWCIQVCVCVVYTEVCVCVCVCVHVVPQTIACSHISLVVIAQTNAHGKWMCSEAGRH